MPVHTSVPRDVTALLQFQNHIQALLREYGSDAQVDLRVVTERAGGVSTITASVPTLGIVVKESVWLLAGPASVADAIQLLAERVMGAVLTVWVPCLNAATIEAVRDGLMVEEEWAA